MPINREYVGRTFSSTRGYEISREKIREFADAIGDQNPAYRTDDPVAPPTFPTVIDLHVSGDALADGDLGLEFSRAVHGEQRYVYERLMKPGDVISTSTTITEIKDAGRNEIMVLVTEYRDARNDLVCTGHNTVVSRGTAVEAQT